MRILVLSDSHGMAQWLRNAIEQQPATEAVVFLGDGARELKLVEDCLAGKRVYCVQGNNDLYCDFPKNQIIREQGESIYITHGHYEYIKSGTDRLLAAARQNNCNIALYGHTHIQRYEYCDGVHLFCPGAVMSKEYGAVDITEDGIMCLKMKIK